MKQQIRFCRSFDGTRIAFAVPWLTALSSGRSLVRMEERDRPPRTAAASSSTGARCR